MLETNISNSIELEALVKVNIEDGNYVTKAEIDNAMAIVNSLDFKLQTKKMVEYNNLDKFYVEKCIFMYKNFLCLKLVYKDIELVPNSMIDEAWHQHILDTKKYGEDCLLMFGEFLHHYPYFGLRGEEDVINWKRTSDTTAKIYKYHFGKKLYEGDMARGCNSQSCW